jgi:hypothetical protein
LKDLLEVVQHLRVLSFDEGRGSDDDVGREGGEEGACLSWDRKEATLVSAM